MPLKKHLLITTVFFLALAGAVQAQTSTFRENNKWGIRENSTVVIRPAYDTIFNFAVSGKVCMACQKAMVPSQNKFIKALTKIYLCNYLNREGKPLSIKADGKDTCSVFTFGKNTVRQFTENPEYFVVSVKSRKHLISKDFVQMTSKGYHEILYTDVPEFIIAQQIDGANTVSSGLINLREEVIIPFQYSDLRINTNDSLIAGCSSGVRQGAEDDVFNYSGKKVGAYRKHVDLATKNFIIHKIYEPKEHYIINNIVTKEETILNAEEVRAYNHDEIKVRFKNDWFIYNMLTNEKKPGKKS